ncbi:hypothetical protein SAMN05660909_03581 [Chitinophaga terrae (ex Kim and Jung 2007)]|jgi:hypothetical protein|uniref:Uncharacterized protein n=1 Tax=Chitinophaga terrae (ex Kim and Jung 2007) TaxID=408074 RepID=A0A1H4EAN6_9BACT|nr:hypothetical protein [Chitinophaga terrae (ex Kim and Jung 2007)]MDQ0105454.1 hypothetical protein [Chitinophaga terrae (ex Kim and Jung 2007)]GEP91497.1 hypothetical protein CTE07_31420 [Chitinophaga terrae (ex Kim and Jung 2007)]SEA81869.1 hypothetical protein SAMN05660909_03581 [Chitinophaga terrae (ex Kim and Jung 2007)]
MNDKNKKPQKKAGEENESRDEQFPGYPTYPASEDIMNNDKEANIDIDEVTGSFRRNSELPEREERPFDESDEQEETWRKDKVGDDLDVPGAELDDDLEDIGEEDEENNIYSLGGDRHEDLEDDNGEFLDFEDDERDSQ